MARQFTKYPSGYVRANTSTKIPPICKWVISEMERGTSFEFPIKLEIGDLYASRRAGYTDMFDPVSYVDLGRIY